MDLKSNHSPPVLTDPAPMNKSRSGIHSAVLPYSSTGAALSIAPFLTIPRKKPGLCVDVRSISWLDAMQSSSPTHKKIIKGPSTELATDNDFSYRNWMLKYPSALTSFEKITNYAKGKRIALFLDYDGTLSPIVDDPDRVFMSDAMRAAVRNVAKYFPTAIISGRSRYKVYEFVGLTELYYAGSHRMDIMGPVWPFDKSHTNYIRSTSEPGKEVNFFQPASEFFPMIDEVYRFLVEITREIKGAKVENNKLCVFVHYRNVDEKNWTTLAQSVHNLFKHYPCLRLTHGRKVLEVRPVLNWYEGKEVNLFQRASGFLPMIDEVYRSLVEITEEIKGAKVENNKFCVSVHYSNVDEKSWTTIAQSVHKILKHYPCLRLTHGRKVSEVRPVLNWDKGKVVEFLLESLGLSNCDNVLPIYIGDDRTDEDAFKVLREGNRGYGILVSSMPKESNAFYSLRDPSEVMDFLKSLVTWKKSSAL